MTARARRRRLRRRRRLTAPEIEPTPVYTLSPTDDSAEVDDGEGEGWTVTDGLELEKVDVVPVVRLVEVLAGLAAGHGRAIDVGVGEDLWVRVHADGTTVVADRPWGPQRYAEMRERDRRDRALEEAMAGAWSRVVTAVVHGPVRIWRRVSRALWQVGGAAARGAGLVCELAASAWGSAVRAGQGWRLAQLGSRTGRHHVTREENRYEHQ